MNTPSLRKTRQAVVGLIRLSKQHAEAINASINAIEATRDDLDTFMGLTFFERLRWLFTGSIGHGTTDSEAAEGPTGEQVRAE